MTHGNALVFKLAENRKKLDMISCKINMIN